MTRTFSTAPAILPSAWCIPGTNHRYSEEQLAIMRSPATVVVGQAFAGTGKSTTGIGYAAVNTDKRILVICFNRANADESRPKFKAVHPDILVVTTHSLAFRDLPPGRVARVVKRWGALTLRHELPLVGARGDMRTAAVVASLLLEFFTTTDLEVDPFLHGQAARQNYNVDDEMLAQCAVAAQRLWLAMNTEACVPGLQGDRNTIAIPPDAYLKRFVLRGGNLGFHTVIFDEAQDANPIMLQLLKNQYTTGSKVIMLGDRHQSIYEFRGAVNAMDHLPDGAAILPLTQSRRFGPRTAWLANRVLGELKDERLDIEGMGEDVRYDKTRHVLAYLSRTNVDLLARAAGVNGEGVHWVGGIESYRVGILNDVYALRLGQFDAIQDANIRKDFRSWQDFLSVAEHDTETRILAELVETYDSEIPTLVRNLIQNQASAAHPRSMDLSTLHRSKGLEFDFVKISDDTRDVFVSAEEWLAGGEGDFPEQEVNLMYVGFTRARHALLPNFETESWLRNLIASRASRVRRWQPGHRAGGMPPAPRASQPPRAAAPAAQPAGSPAVASSPAAPGRTSPRKVMRPGFISQNNVR